jgi:hypothetical protein
LLHSCSCASQFATSQLGTCVFPCSQASPASKAKNNFISHYQEHSMTDKTSAKAKPSATARATAQAKENERPLVEDIRLLGRILGDVIREQEGKEAYELVEQVRKLSVAFRRDSDANADKALKRLLASLSAEATVSVIRAFTYFSHLANLAEDRHHIRRRAIHERAGDTQEGSLTVALSRLKAAGIAPKSIVQTLAHSHVSPVLTAHPTEVQRKSIWMPNVALPSSWVCVTTSNLALPCTPLSKHPMLWQHVNSPPTKCNCARACCSCGKRACCASPSSQCQTRLKTH